MGWSSDFISRLGASSIVPRFKLHFMELDNCLGGDFTIYSTGSAGLNIGARGPVVNGSRVTPQSWDVSFGGFTVPIVGDIQEALNTIHKGQFAELLCSLGAGYQKIAMGQLRTITSSSPVEWSFEFADLLSGLQNSHDGRQNVAVGSANIELYAPFFYLAGQEVSATAWNPGTKELTVDNVLVFKRESGINGLAKLIEGGVTKYYSFSSGWTTSSPAGILQIVNTDVYPTSNSDSITVASAKVYPVAKLQGFPGHILAKIILSGSSNATYNTYPDDWGAGGSWGGLIDFDDMNNFRSALRTGTGAAYTWDLIVESPFSSGLRDLCTIASSVGQWPVWRQNQLSWRGCTSMRTGNYPSPAEHITESDIFKIERNDIWDPDVRSVIPGVQILHSTDGNGADYSYSLQPAVGSLMSSLPARIRTQIDGSKLYDGTPYTSGGRSLRSDQASGDALRMSDWFQYIHQKITLKTNLRLAGLVPGDIVEVTCRYLYSDAQPTSETFQAQRCMVLGVSYSMTDGYCQVTIATR